MSGPVGSRDVVNNSNVGEGTGFSCLDPGPSFTEANSCGVLSRFATPVSRDWLMVQVLVFPQSN